MLGIKDVFKRNTLSFNFYLLPIVRQEGIIIHFGKMWNRTILVESHHIDFSIMKTVCNRCPFFE